MATTLTFEEVQNIAKGIEQRIWKAKERKRTLYPANSNTPSTLGHPCLLFLVYRRLNWEDALLPDVELQFIYDEGKEHEELVRKTLAEAGIPLIESQRPYRWEEYNINGKIDGKALWDNIALPTEVKAVSPYIYDSINNINDVKDHKLYYVKGWFIQVNLYLLLAEEEYGLLIFKNKVNGRIKVIPVAIDYDAGEEALRKAEKVEKYVQEHKYPEPMRYDPTVCEKCPFRHICPVEVRASDVVIAEQLEALLDRINELKPYKEEYEKLWDDLKKKIEGKEKIVAGKYFIVQKKIRRVVYKVPKEIKEQYKSYTEYWKPEITIVE